jgi:hypothetical protein
MNQLVVTNGFSKALFQKEDAGWVPDWFYESGRPMLRFKDHEWLGIGHVKPRFADKVKELKNGGIWAYWAKVLKGRSPR